MVGLALALTLEGRGHDDDDRENDVSDGCATGRPICSSAGTGSSRVMRSDIDRTLVRTSAMVAIWASSPSMSCWLPL